MAKVFDKGNQTKSKCTLCADRSLKVKYHMIRRKAYSAAILMCPMKLLVHV